MRYDFTNIGKEVCADEYYLKSVYDSLEWVEVKPKLEMPFSQGYAINAFIKTFKVPKVSHVSWDGANVGSLGMYAVRGHYSNGVVDLCFVDDGYQLIPIMNVVHD